MVVWHLAHVGGEWRAFLVARSVCLLWVSVFCRFGVALFVGVVVEVYVVFVY